ncbi:MAG: transposase [Spartobacteria bacterium]|nr:transposase [Spartobacteria bacterium]
MIYSDSHIFTYCLTLLRAEGLIFPIMRRRRIKRRPLAYYHCMTRIVGRQWLLGEAEKMHMHQLIRRVEGFSGVRVLTYALMSNHIHLLLEEPDQDSVVGEDELLARMQSLYTEGEMDEILTRWSFWEEMGNREAVICDKLRYTKRMHDISDFMKTLKHRFSFWYNRTHGRKGTLWEERFKSVLVEDGEVLRTVAAYIEMNPVRAGIVTDPSEYRFCGFGEAAGGGMRARDGIIEVMVQKGATFGAGAKRDWLRESTRYFKKVLTYAEGDGEKGAMPAERLLCRSRYFTDGQVLGGQKFVEAFFKENKDFFGPHRESGGRKVKGDWNALYAIRDVGRNT